MVLPLPVFSNLFCCILKQKTTYTKLSAFIQYSYSHYVACFARLNIKTATRKYWFELIPKTLGLLRMLLIYLFKHWLIVVTYWLDFAHYCPHQNFLFLILIVVNSFVLLLCYSIETPSRNYVLLLDSVIELLIVVDWKPFLVQSFDFDLVFYCELSTKQVTDVKTVVLEHLSNQTVALRWYNWSVMGHEWIRPGAWAWH